MVSGMAWGSMVDWVLHVGSVFLLYKLPTSTTLRVVPYPPPPLIFPLPIPHYPLLLLKETATKIEPSNSKHFIDFYKNLFKTRLSVNRQLSQIVLVQFCSNFDVIISTINSLTDSETPIFLAPFIKKK